MGSPSSSPLPTSGPRKASWERLLKMPEYSSASPNASRKRCARASSGSAERSAKVWSAARKLRAEPGVTQHGRALLGAGAGAEHDQPEHQAATQHAQHQKSSSEVNTKLQAPASGGAGSGLAFWIERTHAFVVPGVSGAACDLRLALHVARGVELHLHLRGERLHAEVARQRPVAAHVDARIAHPAGHLRRDRAPGPTPPRRGPPSAPAPPAPPAAGSSRSARSCAITSSYSCSGARRLLFRHGCGLRLGLEGSAPSGAPRARVSGAWASAGARPAAPRALHSAPRRGSP